MTYTKPLEYVIKASGKLLIDENLDYLCSELITLAENRHQFALVLGGGTQYNNIPGYQNAKKIDGLRVTPKDLMESITEIAFANQYKVSQKLCTPIVKPTEIPTNAICAKPHPNQELGYVGIVDHIEPSWIELHTKNGVIPILTHLGFCKDNHELYNINATTVAKEVAKSLGAKNLILLGDKPVCDKEGKVIQKIGSKAEAEKLIEEGVITDGMVLNVKETYDFLESGGESVYITSLQSAGLLEEIIEKSNGTLMVS
jgi:acetylglutamate kinase